MTQLARYIKCPFHRAPVVLDERGESFESLGCLLIPRLGSLGYAMAAPLGLADADCAPTVLDLAQICWRRFSLAPTERRPPDAALIRIRDDVLVGYRLFAHDLASFDFVDHFDHADGLGVLRPGNGDAIPDGAGGALACDKRRA